ncbi:hypothetical protein [Paenibacillus sp. GCM10027626]|uniref:hypothetical protein n=1 Tax=Paenibacillus sp. GCM10027626 TaxID=3273411 RepID=UPI00363DDC7A
MNLSESQCYTAFIDILGISDLIERNLPIARDKLSLFHDHVRKFVSNSPSGLKQSVVFSDSLILVWENIDSAIDGCSQLFAEVYDSNGQFFQHYYGDQYKYRSLFLRGAISEGTLELEDEVVSESSTQRFIIGSGLSRSAKGESLVKGSRLLLLGEWTALDHNLLSPVSLFPKAKISREIMWPLIKSAQFRNVDRFKWILSLCELYRTDPTSVSKHFRDTLWLLMRSLLQEQNLDVRELQEIITLFDQAKFIDIENGYWLPILLCLAETISKYPDLRSSYGLNVELSKLIYMYSSLALMENR